MKLYLAVVYFGDGDTRMHYLGIWDDFDTAEKKVSIWLNAFEEDTYESAAGWVIEFELNKHDLGKRTLIGTA